MSVSSIKIEKCFDFLCNFPGIHIKLRATYCLKHWNWAKFLQAPQSAKSPNLSVCQSKNCLISVILLLISTRHQLCFRLVIQNFMCKLEMMNFVVPFQKLFYPCSWKGANWVNIGRTGVIFSKVSSYLLI